MEASKISRPVEFRFTDPADVATYGDQWYRYAEGDLVRKPARELIELEGLLGMPVLDVMNGMRASTILGDTACAWLGVRAVDEKLAGPFDDFNPITLLIEWRPALEPEGKDEAPTEGELIPPAPATLAPRDEGSQAPARSETKASDSTVTVALQTLPITA